MDGFSSATRRSACGRVVLLCIALLLTACSAAPQGSATPPVPTPEQPSGSFLVPVAEAAELPKEPNPTATPFSISVPTPVPSATPTTAPPSGPTTVPTPSPRPEGTPPRVGLQIGHLRSNELPDELAHLRTSTGARYGSITEADLNGDIATRVKALLEVQGVVVDLLPATVPPSYDADAFLAIHADGSRGSAARGWKLATPWRASRAAQQLLAAVASTYGTATGMPEDVGGITVNMRGYYAFNYRRHVHAIARTTPGIIVEIGFMTNAADRAVMFDQPDRVARGIADGVLAYLGQRDPNDGAALLPPEYPSLRTADGGATMRSAPQDDARVVARLDGDQRVFAIDRRDGWYQVFARSVPNTSGWIREDQLVVSTTPAPVPTSTNP